MKTLVNFILRDLFILQRHCLWFRQGGCQSADQCFIKYVFILHKKERTFNNDARSWLTYT